MQRFEYVCAHDLPPTSGFHQRLARMWADVERETSGALTVEVQPWGTAGPAQTMIEKVISGEIQFHPVSGMPLSTKLPLIAMEGLPFAYPSSAAAARVMDGPLGDYLRGSAAAIGLHVLKEVWPQGHNQLIHTRPGGPTTVEELDGFPIRVGQSPFLIDLYRSLGAAPVPLNLQQAREAVLDGTVGGVEMPYWGLRELGTPDAVRAVVDCDIRWATFWMTTNAEAWTALPPALRSVVERANKRHSAAHQTEYDSLNDSSRSRLADSGTPVHSFDRTELRERLGGSGFYTRWRAEFGERAWALLNAATGFSGEAVPPPQQVR
jgi:TRAP-type C4-dicarboxylate transport system substrate-binding protein